MMNHWANKARNFTASAVFFVSYLLLLDLNKLRFALTVGGGKIDDATPSYMRHDTRASLHLLGLFPKRWPL